MKLYPKDATSTGEKISYTAVAIFFFGLFLFLQLSALGVFNNFYSIACREAGWLWKAPGLLFAGAFLFKAYQMAKDEAKVNLFLLFVLLALSIGFHCGFAYPYYIK